MQLPSTILHFSLRVIAAERSVGELWRPLVQTPQACRHRPVTALETSSQTYTLTTATPECLVACFQPIFQSTVVRRQLPDLSHLDRYIKDVVDALAVLCILKPPSEFMQTVLALYKLPIIQPILWSLNSTSYGPVLNR